MKSIAILLFDEVEVLDFAGPFEVFSVTGRRRLGEPYEVFTVAEKPLVTARNSLVITPTYTFETCPHADFLLVPGGGGYRDDGTAFGSRREMNNPVLLKWVRERSEDAAHLLSVCTGALILAKAQLLENLSATTHYLALDSLRKISPTIRVTADKRYIDNGKVVLSAGVSAGIDMSLYMVSKMQGMEVALETAHYMEYDWKQNELSL